MGPSRRVLVVEPWYTGSHRAWAEGLQQHSRHRIHLLTRARGGWRSTFREAAAELAARPTPAPDLVMASSMMDAAEYRARSRFPEVPLALYLHENQLTYDRATPDLVRGAVNWGSVEAADRVAFNSRFHLEDFFAAVPRLGVTARSVTAARDRSTVLPVGIEETFRPLRHRADGSPVVLWNHRWQTDKAPDSFVSAVLACADLDFRLVLAGPGRPPDRLLERFGSRVLHAGYAPGDRYRALLQQADIVVSCARQEFFGVAVAEAMACGAIPLVPDRLAYPELLGPGLAECRYRPGSLPGRLRSYLDDPAALRSLRPAAAAAGRRFGWSDVVTGYDTLIDAMT